MGADNFQTFALGKTPGIAFDRAVAEAQYQYGHGGYTGTIAEKNGFKLAGEINTFHIDKLEDCFWVAINGERLGKIPAPIREMVVKFAPIYEDKWGPAVCLQLTGTRSHQIKRDRGVPKTWDKVWVFMGMASS